MSTLRDLLTDERRHAALVESLRGLVESEVAAKRGISGAALKTGFGVVKKLRPGIIAEAIRILLPDFADAMQPDFETALGAGAEGSAARFRSELESDPDRSAERLLAVTDRRISEAGPTLRKTYAGLRKTAKKHVMEAVPGLAQTLEPHLAAAEGELAAEETAS